MSDSVLSRFRGAVAGAILGKRWASRVASFPAAPLWVLEPAIDFCDPDASNPFGNACLVERVCDRLLESGTLTLAHFSDASLAISWTDGNATELDPDVWIALLPIILSFHEDDARLVASLQQVTQAWEFSSEATEAVLGVAYAIALPLKETFKDSLNPEALLSHILDRLSLLEKNSIARQLLRRLQIFIADGSSLESVRGLLGRQTSTQSTHNEFSTCTQAVALAFYCFLSTPGDLQAGVRRSLQLQYQPQLVATLVGAIAGAYHGYAGIPLSWRVALSPEMEFNSDRLATQLWAAWSGICNPMRPLDKLEEMAAVTAPGILRPR